MPAPTSFQKRLAALVLDQHEKFSLLRESQPPLSTQIAQYWTGLGLKFPGVGTAWSAVFISWCVKTAGATAKQFRFSPMHSVFVFQAIRNAAVPGSVFIGRDVGQYSPKLGDILQNNRDPKLKANFAFASTHTSYSSHSAVVFEVGVDSAGRYLRTIGGNESDSVGMKEVRLDAQGRVKNPQGLYISVIETLL